MINYLQIRLLFILMSLIPFSLLGQKQVHVAGFVTDSLGSPIDYVSVYASIAQTNAVVSFTHTNEQGHYSLSIPSVGSPISVTASMLGFKKESYLLNIQKDTQSNKRLDFTLFPNPFSIDEVVVREKLPAIVSKSDTTEYHVAAFSDSTEYSVEDLLKKLPGVNVSEQGAITVNGKGIDKVLIEGDDVFGANYTIITRNVRVNMIEKIQVIDHYQDNPVLKDVNPSESMVLNLAIHQDKKRILSGTLTLGGGYGKEWKGYWHTNLFSFSKKSKTILLSNWNNNGFNAMGELNAVSGSFLSGGQGLERGILDNISLLTLPAIQNIGLPTKFTNRNRTGMLALSQIFNVTNQFKIKLSGMLVSDLNKQFYSNKTDYLLEFPKLYLEEETNFIKEGKTYNFELKTDYISPKKTSSIRTFSKIESKNNDYRLNVLRSLPTQKNLVPVKLEDNPKNYYAAGEYTTKLGNYSVGQIAFNFSQVNYPQILKSASGNYPLFFGVDTTFVNLKQKSIWGQKVFSPFLRYIFNKNNYELNFDMGNEFNESKLNSNINLQNGGDNEIQAGMPFYNFRIIQRKNNFLKSYLKKKFKQFDISVGVDVKYLSFQTTCEGNCKKEESNLWLITPAFRFRFTPNNDLRLNFSYRYKTDLPEEERLFNSWYLSDYQTIRKGLIQISPINKHHFRTSFRYRNLEETFFFNTGFSIFLSHSEWGASFVLTSFPFSQEYFQPIKEDVFLYQLQAEKYFPKLESRFSIRLNYSRFGSENQVNNMLRNVSNEYFKFNLDYGSAFDEWFNLFLTNDFIIGESVVREISNTDSFSSFRWQTRAKGVFKIAKNLWFDASFYSVNNYFKKRKAGEYLSMDFNASLRIGDKKYQGELTFSVVNLFRTKYFEQLTVADYYINKFQLEAVPLFFILKWDTSL